MDAQNIERIGSFAGKVTARNTNGTGSIQITSVYGDATNIVKVGDELAIPADGFSAQQPYARVGGYAEGTVAQVNGGDVVALDVTNPV